MKINLQDIVQILELPSTSLNFLKNPDYKEAQKGLNEFKHLVKKQRRQLAKKYHPDLGHSPEKMKQINQVADLIRTLHLEFKRPQVQIVRIFVYNSNSVYYSSTTTTSMGY